MNKLLLVLVLLGFIFAGCGQMAVDSEFWQHDSLYKNWDHTWYSIGEWQRPSAEWGKKSEAQDWWGLDVPYKPE